MNVVWIVIDSLRADRMGCYGYSRSTTPNLDRLAAGAVRFTRCVSPHIPTQPAHTTMFTGRDVFAHQIVAQGGRRELDPEVRLLPDLLRERGIFTGAVDNIGRWFAPAFERYVEYPRWDHDGSQPWRSGEEVTRRALALLDEAAGRQPFFLFFHYWDPHTPYLPPPPFDRMFYAGDERDPAHRSMEAVWASPWFRNYFSEWLPGVTDIEYVLAQYDASIAYADHALGPILDRLESRDLADTLLIVCADHGEELDEHGCWFDHHGLYDTNVRVPLIMRPPGGGPGGRASDEPVTLLDLAPTVLEATGLAEVAAAHGMAGTSLGARASPPGSAAFQAACPEPPGRQRSQASPEPPGRRCSQTSPDMPPGRRRSQGISQGVYLTECTWMRKRGWRTGGWKLIEALEADIYGRPPVELYDLAADPGETRNLADDRPEVARALLAEMHAWVHRRLAETAGVDPLVDQADALRIWQPRFIEGKR